MALLNEILVGRFNRFAQKLLSMKGPAAVRQLQGELALHIPLFHGAENRYLEAWDLFGVAVDIPALGAGNFSTLVARNPLGSNVMAVLTRIQFNFELVTGGVILTLFRPGSTGANAGDESNIIPAQGWDGRGRPSSTTIISRNAAAAVVRANGVAILDMGNVTANANVEMLQPHDEVPLSPGSLITLSAAAANDSITANFWWRERYLEDSERS